MDINLFDYQLPEELIAQYPMRKRDESRLLVLERKSGKLHIHPFKKIIDFLNPRDALVINNTKVFKARLIGKRQTGATIEIFLIRQHKDSEAFWEALAKPSRRLHEGEEIFFYKDNHSEKLTLTLHNELGDGKWIISFESKQIQQRIIDNFGHVPLPPYIKRVDMPDDIDRYQTIFARNDKTGAVAAPTAGFHFTPSLIDALGKKGIKIVELTLHVGPGTFKPVQVDNIEHHIVDPEYAVLSSTAADLLNETRANGGEIFAVGSTSVRTLESAPISKGRISPFEGMVDLYIKPGFKFNIVNHLITNFHLPKSSLLILVAAFAGRERILEAYQKAIENRFRFYSYGDAMLIL
ncbi:MAG: tRNA preQ1(34) S-adenosylmethionine ribosyltransferase-isomerase QueA [FCB group bacterium]|nr:tRNA preQ1(34) S-adenosylmethionine ribosyltransferase-isomerase QueA [FCB group bacterium]